MAIASRLGLTMLATLVVLVGACSSSTDGAATNLMVWMGDKDITLSADEVPAGQVTFMIMNRGTIVHSLVIVRTDVPHDQMALDPNDPSKVSETGSIAVTGQMDVGSGKQISRRLVPGKYVLVCNEPAHYAVGMHRGLVVK